jgi:phosphatidylcholine synthase
MKNWNAWAVHLLTASGAPIALVATLAAMRQDWRAVFLLLGVALIIDGIDGPLARRLDTSGRLPWFDGVRLDLVVDYTTYVLVPAIALVLSGLLSEPSATIAGIVIAITGVLYFADIRMKTDDAAFRGFPAVWNAVVFALMVLKLPEPLILIIVAGFAALTFAPVEFVHPFRVERWRPLTLAMTAAWGLLSIASLAANLDPGPVVAVAFALASLYFALVGVVLQFTRAAAPAP